MLPSQSIGGLAGVQIREAVILDGVFRPANYCRRCLKDAEASGSSCA